LVKASKSLINYTLGSVVVILLYLQQANETILIIIRDCQRLFLSL